MERLIASIVFDPEGEAAWEQVANQRDAELEAGTVTAIPGDEAMANISIWRSTRCCGANAANFPYYPYQQKLEESIMLELRPTCEHCNKSLPPNSTEARICTFECTFCAVCVDGILANTCPNCGGGFVPRPIRPSQNWKNNNFLGAYPASTVIKHRPVNLEAHAKMLAAQGGLPADQR